MIYLVHHGKATDPMVNAQRPLTADGKVAVRELAVYAKDRGAVPVEIWHSGKLRARQTAEAFRAVCNPLAAFSMVRGLQSADPSDIMADRLVWECRNLMLVGHMPHVDRLLRRLVGRIGAEDQIQFPSHGLVALFSNDNGVTWLEAWRSG
jgi:phosphohistidine phosphatase